MTFLEIQNNVKQWLGDRSDLDIALIKREINNEYKKLAIPFRFHQNEQTNTSLSTVSGQQSLDISSLGEVYSIPIVRDTTNDRKLKQKTIEWLERRSDPDMEGEPEYYVLYGDSELLFYPVPDGAYSLRLRYQSLPANMTSDAESPIWPSDWHTIIEYGAAAKAAFMYNMDERGRFLKNQYVSELGTRVEPGTLDRHNIDTSVDVVRTRG